MNSMIHKLFHANESVEKRLVEYRVNRDDKKWAEKAVKVLVQRLEKQQAGRESLEELVRALADPHRQSKCVTIPRSIDGRLQIAHRKGLPHVMFCKLWRWPDLKSHHELRPHKFCQAPFVSGREEVCIVPYHYERVEPPNLQPIVIPKIDEGLRFEHAQNLPTFLNYPMPRVPADEANRQSQLDPYCQTVDSPTSISDYPISLPVLQKPYIANRQNSTTVPYTEQCQWATICYYELGSRVGDAFPCRPTVITVDGFMDPTNVDRLCLGQFANPQSNETIEKTKKNIGSGIQLHYVCGEVWIFNQSNYAIYVQSQNFNVENQQSLNTVVKIQPNQEVKVFDNVLFSNILEKTVTHGYKAVFDLTYMCYVRLSFIKGWGSNYKRQDVTHTPCWIEIQLHNPLEWLSRVLETMAPCHVPISSIS